MSFPILSQPTPPLPAKVPVEVRAIIERCLEKKPGERYQQVSQVRAALEAVHAGAVLASWATWKYVLSRRRLLAGAGAAGALAIMLGTLVGVNVGGLRDRLLGTPGAARIQSLAVLPLANLTGDPDQAYFADGIHARLHAVPGPHHRAGDHGINACRG